MREDTIEIRDVSSAHSKHFEVWVHLPSGRRTSIDVYGPSIRFGRPVPAKVNWPAIGASVADDTGAFALALQQAVEIADALNEEAGR